ncbi:hypothetical protein SEA_NOSHOW_23 [Mycobacterium phage NoShow]|nr:hypothetical protein SEA_NOSHOW_23 [Mycobacterium phage NoShow]
MANPENVEDYQFGINYTVSQGDPEDPNVDWDTMTVFSGEGQNGLDQASYQYASIIAANPPNVRNCQIVFAPKVAWNVWELPTPAPTEEVTDGTD